MKRQRVSLNTIKKDVAARYGVILKLPYVQKIAKRVPDLEIDWDTQSREAFIDAVAQDLGLGHWPLGMTPKRATTAFFNALPAALKAAGQAYEE